jgi:aspartyl-tRNA(Asn)/glutamyl-tRNA(Gln) amidotransferase subunit A
VAGKTNLDEFGMGSHSTHSFFGAVWNQRRQETARSSAGGSSGGSAVAVATGQCIA